MPPRLLSACLAAAAGIAALAATGATKSTVLVTASGLLARPGLIRLVHRDLDSPAVVDATAKAYGLRCSGSTQTFSADMKTLLARATDCDVEKGQETYWLEVLSQAPGVLRAELVPLQTASTSNETPQVYFRPQAPKDNAPAPGVAGPAALIGFFEERYRQAAKVSVLRQDDRVVEVQISRLRGAVVPTASLWERLTICAALVGTAQAERAYLVVDGRFAHGVGKREPAASRYEDMTGTYDAELATYVGELTHALATRFSGGPP
jgi:hypothetical protein